jgi:hypothetical protein
MSEVNEMVEKARSAALGGKLRIEVFEHNGVNYAVVQSNTRMSRKAENKTSLYDRLLISVVESLHVALPVMKDGAQATETTDEPVMVPVLDEEGRPVVAPLCGGDGKPVISTDGKPIMRPVMKQQINDKGEPVTASVTRSSWSLGPKVFGPEFIEDLNEEPNDDDSLLGKAFMALAAVNDKQKARARAKNP